MSNYKTTGIVIKKYPLNDHDQIIILFTSTQGKLKAVQKNFHKISSAGGLALELFSESDLVISPRNSLDVIYNAEVLAHNKNIRNNFKLYELACYYAAVINKLSWENHTDHQLYALLKNKLSSLNNKSNLQKEKNNFQLELLKTEGIISEETKTITGSEFEQQLADLIGVHLGKS